MYLNRYGRQIGVTRDLLEAPLVEEFPQVGPMGIAATPWENVGEWFADAGFGTERRQSPFLRSRLVPPPGEVKE